MKAGYVAAEDHLGYQLQDPSDLLQFVAKDTTALCVTNFSHRTFAAGLGQAGYAAAEDHSVICFSLWKET